ncbi:serine/threonine protein kinase [Terracidiphilus gabretensis]|uniref:serine/threonine protein kinase n=1 Tax=Terracidiphilus gabretensis TaxID=1577687 RepID=UPI00071BCD32|nr:serine/threonine-protein kinase [Terracidiphilus gabretensis]
MASDANQRIGDYEIIAPIGAGGMGRVFKVRNVISNREEAMKVLLPDFAAQPELAARFLAEIRTLGTLEHPNIAQLRTAFQYQNHFVMVMEYVEGATLEKLASPGPIPLEQMLDYASQTLAGLSYAHSHGVTHRDIKPANIMITSHGVAKLMDFGIAKGTEDVQLTRPGTTMGSVYYMSPEQVQGGPIDARSDIYSFGVTLYELFTGKKPFVSESSYTVLNAQINENPVPLIEVNPSLPVALNEIVLTAMAKDPAARFQSADAFRNALRSVREPQAAAPTPVSAPAVAAPAMAAASATAVAGAVPLAAVAASGVPGPVPVPSTASAPQPNEAPKFTPVPQVVPAAQKSKGNRGLWITLGAIAAVLAIAAVATLGPRFYPMLMAKRSSAPATNPAQPEATPAPATPPASTPSSAEMASATPVQPASGSVGSSLAAGAPAANANPAAPRPAANGAAGSGQAGSGSAGSASSGQRTNAPAVRQPYVPQSANAPPAPAVPSPEQIREVKDKLMNLSARADAARGGVQALRTQQQAQGLDLRTDIVSSMSRMDSNLAEARQSLNARDLSTANEYIAQAEREVAKLEAFLGH